MQSASKSSHLAFWSLGGGKPHLHVQADDSCASVKLAALVPPREQSASISYTDIG